MKFDLNYFLKLAKLSVEEREKELLADQMEKIIEWVDRIRKMDLKEEGNFFEHKELKIIKREDVVRPGLKKEEALSNSPERDEGYFVVPAVIKK